MYEVWPGDRLRYVGRLIQFVETRRDWRTKQWRCGWGMVVCGVAEKGPSVNHLRALTVDKHMHSRLVSCWC